MEHIAKMFIAGEWVLSKSGKTREIINPANSEVIATVTEVDENDAKKAIAAVKRAFYESEWWGALAAERAKLLFTAN